MNKNWYNNCFPKVKDLIPSIKNIAKEIKTIDGVKNIYLWGSVAENLKNLDFPVRNLNIIASTKFLSDDLISINEGKNSPLKMAETILEENGYDPKSVNFTKNFIKIKNFNMDHWCLSSDNKLLHYGFIIENFKEYKSIENEILKKVEKEIGIKKEAIYNDNENLMKYQNYHRYYMKQYLENMPIGWYMSNLKIKEIKNKIKKVL